jgi:uncharacterized protein
MFKKKAKVILDTNFFLIPGQFHVDIFTEIKNLMLEPYILCVLDKTFDELKGIEIMGKFSDVRAIKLGAALAHNLIKQQSLKILTSFSDKNVDDSLVEMSKKGVFIATQDKELKKRVKEKGAQIITLKQKKYLVLE